MLRPLPRAARETRVGLRTCRTAPSRWLTHASFAAPASASHFSIATLYSASRLSAVASLRASACLRRRVLACIGGNPVDLGVRLALDQFGLGFLHAHVLGVARQVVALLDRDVVVRLGMRDARAFAGLWRVLVGGFRVGLGDLAPCPWLPRHRCPWRFRRGTRRLPCRACIARRRPSSPGCSSPSTSASGNSSAPSSAPWRHRRNRARRGKHCNHKFGHVISLLFTYVVSAKRTR